MEDMPDSKRARIASLPVVLGTSSKWRRALFETNFPQYGTDFMKPDIDEKAIRAKTPREMTVAIAKGKAQTTRLFPKS